MRLPRHHVRLGVMTILLAMLLMRLVWMEMRHYRYWAPWLPTVGTVHALTLPEAETFPSARTSPVWEMLRQEYFPHGVFQPERFRNTAEFEIAMVVTLAVGVTRLLARSWLAALFVGVGIMSRGRLLAAVETIDPGLLIAALFFAWYAASVWAIRTGVKRTVAAAMTVGWLLMLLEPAFVPLGLAWPVLLLWNRWLARPIAGVPETSAFMPLAISFHDMAHAKRWWRIFLPLHLFSMALAAAALLGWWYVHHPGLFHATSRLPDGFTRLWTQTWVESWDWELSAASLILIATFLFARRTAVPGLKESIHLILIACALVLLGAWASDAWEAMVYPMSIPSFRAGRAWIWVESPLLTLGAVALYQLTFLIGRLAKRVSLSAWIQRLPR